MVEIASWARELARKLEGAFGPRLRFVGYQGSYGRGEATPDSDIDVVTVLDRLDVEDLARYRDLVRSMPSGELACGFICGAEQLAAWPRADLLSLYLDTKPVVGALEPPAFTQAEYGQALALGASALYHGACHGYLYDGAAEALPGLRKGAFFCLRLERLWRAGEYVPALGELRSRLTQEQREMLDTPDVERAYRLLIDWSGSLLTAVNSEEPAASAGGDRL